MNAHELKALETQLNKAQAEILPLHENFKYASDAYHTAVAKRNAIQKRIETEKAKLQFKEPIVSEHALLRYLERIYCINLDDIRAAILSPGTIKAIKVMGNGKIPLPMGGRAVIKDNIVVSITD